MVRFGTGKHWDSHVTLTLPLSPVKSQTGNATHALGTVCLALEGKRRENEERGADWPVMRQGTAGCQLKDGQREGEREEEKWIPLK